MVSKEVENYLSTRYKRFLEYAHYHAALAKLDQQGGDVLNEVLLNVLGKDPGLLDKLYGKKGKGGYREIDFYILRMVKLNCHSTTSPYRFKYKGLARDDNAGMPGLDDNDDEGAGAYHEDQEIQYAVEEPYQGPDRTELICNQMQLVRDVLFLLPVPEREKEIFRWRFFMENTWGEWRGKEKAKQLRETFKRVERLVMAKIQRLKTSYMGVVAKSTYKSERIRQEYQRTLFPSVFRYSRRYIKAQEAKLKYELKLNQITGNHHGY